MRRWTPQQREVRALLLARYAYGLGVDLKRATGIAIHDFKRGMRPLPPSDLSRVRAFLLRQRPDHPAKVCVLLRRAIAKKRVRARDIARAFEVPVARVRLFRRGGAFPRAKLDALEAFLRALPRKALVHDAAPRRRTRDAELVSLEEEVRTLLHKKWFYGMVLECKRQTGVTLASVKAGRLPSRREPLEKVRAFLLQAEDDPQARLRAALRECLTRKRLRSADVARALEVSRSQVSRFAQGTPFPRAKLAALEAFLATLPPKSLADVLREALAAFVQDVWRLVRPHALRRARIASAKARVTRAYAAAAMGDRGGPRPYAATFQGKAALRLYNEGLNILQIAKRIGISRSSVRRILIGGYRSQ